MPHRTVILGLGDRSRADAGFGPGCIARLTARWRFPQGVRVIGADAADDEVRPALAAARALVAFADLDVGLAPGTLQVVHGPRVAATLGLPRETGTGAGAARPERLVLIACQPGTRQARPRPSAPVARQIGPAVEAALTILRGWGVCPVGGPAAPEAAPEATPGTADARTGEPVG
jgi:hydrogenase maturation protease